MTGTALVAALAALAAVPIATGRPPVEGAPGAADAEVARLVAEAQAGSADAFAGLYDRYVDGVYAYVLHRVGHRQTAEDLTADVFTRALRRIGTFRWQGTDVGAWFTTIARNRVHDHFKSSRFRLEATVDEVFDTPDTVSTETPETAALTRDTARLVHAAMRELKSEQAEVLYLRFVRQLSVGEVAAVMGRKEPAIRQLQLRALRSLAKVLPEGLST